ncbi:MAG TPA: hypothetical protein VJ798_03480 [Rhizomicrobium sp.]|nr:hypothetical protein [Rhizomicrobium sp.]
MSEGNGKVARMLLDDAPAARDLAFEVAVLARMEQRRFRRGLAMTAVLAVAATLLLAFLMPGIESVWQQRLAGMLDNWMIAALLVGITLPVQHWIAERA